MIYKNQNEALIFSKMNQVVAVTVLSNFDNTSSAFSISLVYSEEILNTFQGHESNRSIVGQNILFSVIRQSKQRGAIVCMGEFCLCVLGLVFSAVCVVLHPVLYRPLWKLPQYSLFVPQHLHKHCFQFQIKKKLSENKNNAYANFGGTSKEYYGIFQNSLLCCLLA